MVNGGGGGGGEAAGRRGTFRTTVEGGGGRDCKGDEDGGTKGKERTLADERREEIAGMVTAWGCGREFASWRKYAREEDSEAEVVRRGSSIRRVAK